MGTYEVLEPAMRQLRDAWGPGWRIWRGRRDWDRAGERTGAWMASRIIDAAGVDPTVVADTAEQLDRELQRQALAAHAVRQLIAALQARGILANPIGSRIVQAAHPMTAQRETVVLQHSARWNSLAWYWLRDYDTQPIAPTDNLEFIAGAIIDAISGPRTPADRPALRRDPA